MDDVSFTVERGEVFGFLGPNGAGKTTTIGMLCTLLQPTAGTAILNGFDIVAQPHMVRKSIGLVFQDPSLDERLTAQENLDFHARLYRVPREVATRRIAQMLEMVELMTRRDDLVKNFSGGMKRRLEIARGLIHHPRILFLDEPTLGLDPQTRCLIWNYIHELRDTEGVTIFLTTHYMEEAEHCGRIAIIDYGKLIALDTPSGLKKAAGGDRISITTHHIDRAREFLYSRGLSPVMVRERELAFEVPNGDEFLPAFIKQATFDVTSVNLTRPTLEDVFLHKTGRHLRSEGDGSRGAA
ncbi:MAG: ATP-binding cassette domain-containing protein [Nitrospirota bacterium]